MMTGQLVEYDGSGELPPAGSYWKQNGVWYAVTPNGMYANLGNHAVVDHEDGKISVSPSILTTQSGTETRWHGYLYRGIWSEC